MKEYTFEAVARPVKHNGKKEIAAWTDGLSVACDVDDPLGPPAYKLVPGQKYRVTIEPVRK